ncbi:hypothetical protein JCM10207_005190 [Rhodosporidiobolus poonsookiae]
MAPPSPSQAVSSFLSSQPAFFVHVLGGVEVCRQAPIKQFLVPVRRRDRWKHNHGYRLAKSAADGDVLPEEQAYLYVQVRADLLAAAYRQTGYEGPTFNLAHNLIGLFDLHAHPLQVVHDFIIMSTNWVVLVPYEAVLDSWTPAATTGERSRLNFAAFLAQTTISDQKLAGQLSGNPHFREWVDQKLPAAARIYSTAFRDVVVDLFPSRPNTRLDPDTRKRCWRSFCATLSQLAHGGDELHGRAAQWPTALQPAFAQLTRRGIARPPPLWGCCDACTPNTMDMIRHARHAWQLTAKPQFRLPAQPIPEHTPKRRGVERVWP